jgi:hypothetical protein
VEQRNPALKAGRELCLERLAGQHGRELAGGVDEVLANRELVAFGRRRDDVLDALDPLAHVVLVDARHDDVVHLPVRPPWFAGGRSPVRLGHASVDHALTDTGVLSAGPLQGP